MSFWCGLEAKMLGSFELSFEGAPVHLPMKQSSKPVQLLQLLLEAGDAGVSRRRAIEALFGHESKTDAKNSLNVAVSRLRRLLRDALVPDERFITVRCDHYRLDVPFPVTVDANEVESLRRSADLAKGKDRINTLYLLCDRYHGRFLPDLNGENWVEISRAHYERIFRVSLEELCMDCRNRNAWVELDRLVDFGSSVYPYAGWEEWRPPANAAAPRCDRGGKVVFDIDELRRRVASGPIFLGSSREANDEGSVSGNGREDAGDDAGRSDLVILSREDFNRLMKR